MEYGLSVFCLFMCADHCFRRASRSGVGRWCGPLPVRPEPGPVSELPALRQRVVGRVRTTGRLVIGRGGLQRQRPPPLQLRQRTVLQRRGRLPAPSVCDRRCVQRSTVGVHRARISGRPHVVQLSELSVLFASGAGRGAAVLAGQEVPVRRYTAKLSKLPLLLLTIDVGYFPYLLAQCR